MSLYQNRELYSREYKWGYSNQNQDTWEALFKDFFVSETTKETVEAQKALLKYCSHRLFVAKYSNTS